MNSRLNTTEGRSSAGIITPLRVKERLRLEEEANCKEAKRVSGTSCSMANWSSEMLFLKLSDRGWGAAVRYETSAECPPSTSGCDRPEKMVKSRRNWAIASR